VNDTDLEKAAQSPAIHDRLVGIARESLDAFIELANAARAKLSGMRVATPDVFAVIKNCRSFDMT
jgi:hypothetical protein